MNEKPLVSVLSPCYNSEEYVERMLKSILGQTYENIELICIDDGSTDDTASIIKKYIQIYEAKGKKLIYMLCDHKGQAAAINAGLKIIQGEYFTLIDSDDFLDERSIEIRANALINNRDYGVVASDYYIVNENDIHTIIGKGNEYCGNLCFQENQFFIALTGYSPVVPLSYMIRTNDMRKINPNMEINECIEGQNFQILLPMYYHFKRIFIDEPLGYYVIRNDSHAHVNRTREQVKLRNQNLLKMLEEVFFDMNLSKKDITRYTKMSIFYKMLEDA